MATHDQPEIDYRVTLRNQANAADLVVFAVTPELSESRSVNYKSIDPVHAPGQIYAYSGTASRTFSLTAKLISRNTAEAAINLKYLWRLRGWTMPWFGTSTLSDEQRRNREIADTSEDPTSLDLNVGVELRGSPPAVLLLSAYSHGSSYGGHGGRSRQPEHINRVPVVVQSLNIQYPTDVDYIPAEGSGVPMPIIMSVDLSLMETHSPREYENFDLRAYRQGRLSGF